MTVQESIPNDLAASHYYYAAAVSQVELDVLSGETKILLHHSVFDIGKPVNSALTLGQIEGTVRTQFFVDF